MQSALVCSKLFTVIAPKSVGPESYLSSSICWACGLGMDDCQDKLYLPTINWVERQKSIDEGMAKEYVYCIENPNQYKREQGGFKLIRARPQSEPYRLSKDELELFIKLKKAFYLPGGMDKYYKSASIGLVGPIQSRDVFNYANGNVNLHPPVPSQVFMKVKIDVEAQCPFVSHLNIKTKTNGLFRENNSTVSSSRSRSPSPSTNPPNVVNSIKSAFITKLDSCETIDDLLDITIFPSSPLEAKAFATKSSQIFNGRLSVVQCSAIYEHLGADFCKFIDVAFDITIDASSRLESQGASIPSRLQMLSYVVNFLLKVDDYNNLCMDDFKIIMAHFSALANWDNCRLYGVVPYSNLLVKNIIRRTAGERRIDIDEILALFKDVNYKHECKVSYSVYLSLRDFVSSMDIICKELPHITRNVLEFEYSRTTVTNAYDFVEQHCCTDTPTNPSYVESKEPEARSPPHSPRYNPGLVESMSEMTIGESKELLDLRVCVQCGADCNNSDLCQLCMSIFNNVVYKEKEESKVASTTSSTSTVEVPSTLPTVTPVELMAKIASTPSFSEKTKDGVINSIASVSSICTPIADSVYKKMTEGIENLLKPRQDNLEKEIGMSSSKPREENLRSEFLDGGNRSTTGSRAVNSRTTIGSELHPSTGGTADRDDGKSCFPPTTISSTSTSEKSASQERLTDGDIARGIVDKITLPSPQTSEVTDVLDFMPSDFEFITALGKGLNATLAEFSKGSNFMLDFVLCLLFICTTSLTFISSYFCYTIYLESLLLRDPLWRIPLVVIGFVETRSVSFRELMAYLLGSWVIFALGLLQCILVVYYIFKMLLTIVFYIRFKTVMFSSFHGQIYKIEVRYKNIVPVAVKSDARPDIHRQGDLRHVDPQLCNVDVITTTMSTAGGVSMVSTTQHLQVSLSLLNQLSSLKCFTRNGDLSIAMKTIELNIKNSSSVNIPQTQLCNLKFIHSDSCYLAQLLLSYHRDGEVAIKFLTTPTDQCG
jgi:hypothetical protein